jgi:hypothetical protein
MKEGGILMVTNPFYTNDQLTLAIETTNHALSYLQARGDYFGLVTTHLRHDLETLKSFQVARKERNRHEA